MDDVAQSHLNKINAENLSRKPPFYFNNAIVEKTLVQKHADIDK